MTVEPKGGQQAMPGPIAWLGDALRFAKARVRDARVRRLVSRPRGSGSTLGPSRASESSEVGRRSEVGRLLAIARKPRPRAPLEPLAEARVSPELGLEGDCRGKSRRRQITVLTREGWEAAFGELGRELDWTTRRANLFVEGVNLENQTGATLTIGSVVLEITGETTPCSRMDAQAPGLTNALERDWRAGVTCRVLRGGLLKAGDPVSLVPSESRT